MRPYALVEIEDGVESDKRVVGGSNFSVIVVDWDMVESDGTAQELIDEISANYLPGERPSDREQEVIDRLQEIVDGDDELDDDEDDDDLDFDDELDDIEDELDEEEDAEEEDEEVIDAQNNHGQ